MFSLRARRRLSAAPSLFESPHPSICAFPDSLGSSKPPLHCRIVAHHHWLPWRNSPPGLQGTRVYCLWLLYLDENMICWNGSTWVFFSRCRFSLLSSSVSLASINVTQSRDSHCFLLLLSRSLSVFFLLIFSFLCMCVSSFA